MSAANKSPLNMERSQSTEQAEIFALCEDLFKSDYSEEAAVAPTGLQTNQSVRACRLHYSSAGLIPISTTG